MEGRGRGWRGGGGSGGEGEGVEGRLKGTYYVFLCITVQGNMFRNKKVNKELKDLCELDGGRTFASRESCNVFCL